MGSAHRFDALLARRIRTLAEHLPRAIDGHQQDVHQARVASRRLREAVPVAGAAAKRRKVRRLETRLRRITRLLGPIREHDVAIEMIEALDRSGASAELFDAVAQTLARERAARLALFAHRIDHARARRLIARLEKFASGLSDPDKSPEWRELLADRIEARAHALQTAVADAGALFAPERLHAVRVAVKKLRYALELASETRSAPAGALVRQLRETQELLGYLHDRDVLRARLAAMFDQADPRPDLEAARTAAVSGLEREARGLHARYLRRQASLIGIADRALDTMAPRVAVGGTAPR
jgi:CHAD domain-containing protein